VPFRARLTASILSRGDRYRERFPKRSRSPDRSLWVRRSKDIHGPHYCAVVSKTMSWKASLVSSFARELSFHWPSRSEKYLARYRCQDLSRIKLVQLECRESMPRYSCAFSKTTRTRVARETCRRWLNCRQRIDRRGDFRIGLYC